MPIDLTLFNLYKASQVFQPHYRHGGFAGPSGYTAARHHVTDTARPQSRSAMPKITREDRKSFDNKYQDVLPVAPPRAARVVYKRLPMAHTGQVATRESNNLDEYEQALRLGDVTAQNSESDSPGRSDNGNVPTATAERTENGNVQNWLQYNAKPSGQSSGKSPQPNTSKAQDGSGVKGSGSQTSLASSLASSVDTAVSIKAKRKVSFADEGGKSLYKVRVFHQKSSEPPDLDTSLLPRVSEDEESELFPRPTVNQLPRLEITFNQPGADTPAFIAKVDRTMVSLENAVVNGYTVRGTIKVKNLSFEKHVQVRYTMDDWMSFTNVVAEFFPHPSTSSDHDTFSFEFRVAPVYDPGRRLEFCICYAALGNEYWDNNNGQNYVLVWMLDNVPVSDAVPISNVNFNMNEYDNRWSGFFNWHHSNTRILHY